MTSKTNDSGGAETTTNDTIYPCYPWQREQWAGWLRITAGGRIPSALLLSGATGVGIERFGTSLCHSLLCGRAKEGACGECGECRLLASENHPDYLVLASEKREIKVSQIRELGDFFSLKPHYGRYRVAFLPKADDLNHAAANALLKTLEEPPPGGVIVMACLRLSMLPATIRSRCRKIRFPLPGEDAVAWLARELSVDDAQARRRLALFGMRPLDAARKTGAGLDREQFHDELAELLDGGLTLAQAVERWGEQPCALIQQWLLEELQQMARACFDAPRAGTPVVGRPSFGTLQRLHARQSERCRLADDNLNPRLLLESSLLEWQKAFAVVG